MLPSIAIEVLTRIPLGHRPSSKGCHRSIHSRRRRRRNSRRRCSRTAPSRSRPLHIAGGAGSRAHQWIRPQLSRQPIHREIRNESGELRGGTGLFGGQPRCGGRCGAPSPAARTRCCLPRLRSGFFAAAFASPTPLPVTAPCPVVVICGRGGGQHVRQLAQRELVGGLGRCRGRKEERK